MGLLHSVMKRGLKPIVSKLGYDLTRRPRRIRELSIEHVEQTCQRSGKVHYGCGHTLLADWVNLDRGIPKGVVNGENKDAIYWQVDLTSRHPFPDDVFQFGYAQDFLEHLNQADSLILLAESYRTFCPGGVLRLSFPGLEGVLPKHYRHSDYEGAVVGRHEAYDMWAHLHFYSKEELTLVAKHIGFREVNFVEYGQSQHEPLRNLDTRAHQIGLNTYAELTK